MEAQGSWGKSLILEEEWSMRVMGLLEIVPQIQERRPWPSKELWTPQSASPLRSLGQLLALPRKDNLDTL